MQKIVNMMLATAMMLFIISCSKDDSNPVEPSTNNYPSVKIGTQIWMTKNLDVATYRNGDPIRHCQTVEEWKDAAAKSEGAWCYYNNSDSLGKIYGKLYNWYAVNDPRGLAPQGWHVPTELECQKLRHSLGGAYEKVGGKLKAVGTLEDKTGNWHSPNVGATNEVGFSALGGGFRANFQANYQFQYLDSTSNWWTATGLWGNVSNAPMRLAYVLRVYSNSLYCDLHDMYKELGMSVRCIKDVPPVDIPSITIGNQIWSQKNLDVSTYLNGDPIPQVTDSVEWANLTTGAWCYYNNDPANGAIYGKLYNWYALADPRGIAPQGWHISTHADWDTLGLFLGIDVASNKLRTTGTNEDGNGLWRTPNTGATNEVGFSALPGGHREANGEFQRLNWWGTWWSPESLVKGSDKTDKELIWGCRMTYYYSSFSIYYLYKNNGFSVRLVRD